jgi:hypothetical protein
MNESLDLAGSYIIGGLILVALVGLFLHFSNEGENAKLNQINQYTVNDIGNTIEFDFNKMGYGVSSGNKIISFSSSSISFLGDVDHNGTVDTVAYSTYTSGGNTYLKRKAAGVSTHYRINSFTLKGYDSSGNVTSTASNIKSIYVSIKLSQTAIDTAYSQTTISGSWEKTFYPKNL